MILSALVIGAIQYRTTVIAPKPNDVAPGPNANPAPSVATTSTPATTLPPASATLNSVAVDSVPWARTTIRALSPDVKIDVPEQITPFVVNLPEGEYSLQLVNSDMAQPYTYRLRVVKGRDNTAKIALPGFDPDKILSNILDGR